MGEQFEGGVVLHHLEQCGGFFVGDGLSILVLLRLRWKVGRHIAVDVLLLKPQHPQVAGLVDIGAMGARSGGEDNREVRVVLKTGLQPLGQCTVAFFTDLFVNFQGHLIIAIQDHQDPSVLVPAAGRY